MVTLWDPVLATMGQEIDIDPAAILYQTTQLSSNLNSIISLSMVTAIHLSIIHLCHLYMYLFQVILRVRQGLCHHMGNMHSRTRIHVKLSISTKALHHTRVILTNNTLVLPASIMITHP